MLLASLHLKTFVAHHAVAVITRLRRSTDQVDRSDSGQTTAEYALVLLGAAAVAVLLIGWATQTDQVGRLFDFVVDQVVGRAR